jgi:hypothetical protein
MSVSLGDGVSLVLPTDELKLTIENGGAVLTPGLVNSYYTAGNAGRFTGWYLTGFPSGSIVIDFLKKEGGLPTASDSIAGSEKPTLVSQTQNSDITLDTWTTRFNAGDTFAINIQSVSSLTIAVLTLKFLKA